MWAQVDLVLINVNGFLALVGEVLDDERLLPGIEPAKAFKVIDP